MSDRQDHRLLIVDDEPQIREILVRWLRAEGYECETSSSADEAWDVLAGGGFSLVVSDIIMPGKSGIDLLALIGQQYPDVAVLMLTAVDDRETAIYALELGAYGYVVKPFDHSEIVINVANALERRRLVQESRAYQERLEHEVRERTANIRTREQEIVLHLLSAAEVRDGETGAHVRRLGMYTAVLAEGLGWDPRAVDDLRLAAAMHDVGKIGVPDSILRKPGRLTQAEEHLMRGHTLIGAHILDRPDVPLLCLAREVALSHHERWDGSGYPQGLSGDAIPQSARLVAIADVYDALVHDRVYRPALPEEEALAIIARGDGQQFDPQVVGCFSDSLTTVRAVREAISERASYGFANMPLTFPALVPAQASA